MAHSYVQMPIQQIADRQREVMDQSIDILQKFTGKKPNGWLGTGPRPDVRHARSRHRGGLHVVRRLGAGRSAAVGEDRERPDPVDPLQRRDQRHHHDGVTPPRVRGVLFAHQGRVRPPLSREQAVGAHPGDRRAPLRHRPGAPHQVFRVALLVHQQAPGRGALDWPGDLRLVREAGAGADRDSLRASQQRRCRARESGDPVLPVKRSGYDGTSWVYWMPRFRRRHDSGRSATDEDDTMQSWLRSGCDARLSLCHNPRPRPIRLSQQHRSHRRRLRARQRQRRHLAADRRPAEQNLEPAGHHAEPAGRRRRNFGACRLAVAGRRLHAVYAVHLGVPRDPRRTGRRAQHAGRAAARLRVDLSTSWSSRSISAPRTSPASTPSAT